jgi:hypothetical protein
LDAAEPESVVFRLDFTAPWPPAPSVAVTARAPGSTKMHFASPSHGVDWYPSVSPQPSPVQLHRNCFSTPFSRLMSFFSPSCIDDLANREALRTKLPSAPRFGCRLTGAFEMNASLPHALQSAGQLAV